MALEFPDYCELTFKAEGGHLDLVRRVHWPGGSSGVTIGPGYDMGSRAASDVEADLRAAGVTAADAAALAQGAGKKGEDAHAWVKEHRDALPEISEEASRALFAHVYPRFVKQMQSHVSKWGGDWDDLRDDMKEVLVDLHYRGDVFSRDHKSRLVPLVEGGDYAGFKELICDTAYWQENTNLPPSKDGGPNGRIKERSEWLDGARPAASSRSVSGDLSELSESELYDHLRRVWTGARERYEASDAAFAFQDEEGRLNLLGARGLKDGKAVAKNTNTEWDDTLYLLWKEPGGRKRVESFAYSSEFGGKGSALLVLGFHEYKLDFHKKKATHRSLQELKSYSKETKYRALMPFRGVRVWRDVNRNLQRDADEGFDPKPNWSINIHYGGDSESGPKNWSHGCQVIKGWGRYRELIELIEGDHSLKGTIDNELASKPAVDGDRPLIYALLPAEEVLSGAAPRQAGGPCVPLDLGCGVDATPETCEAYYRHTEVETPHGFFPLGANTVWHGGVHVYGRKGDRVRACLPGRVVAARLGDTDQTGQGAYGSTNFVLLRHELSGAELNQANGGEPFDAEAVFACYSLYMHLGQVGLTSSNVELGPFEWLGGGGRSGFVLKEYVNLREAAGTGADAVKICVLSPGDELDLVQAEPVREGKHDWYQVRGRKVAKREGQGKTGWVAYDARWLEDECSGPDQDLLDRLARGEVVAFDDVTVEAGDPLWTLGEYWGDGEGRPRLVHWGIFSEELLFPTFARAEDSDSDFNMDCKQILEMVEQEFWGSDEVLTADEIREFYASNEGAKKLRTTACKFISEWAVDPDQAVSQLKGLKGVLSWGMADRIRPYCWWSMAEAAGAVLPGSRHVWHYNPIAVVAALPARAGAGVTVATC